VIRGVDDPWRRCIVLDLSTKGAGLELFDLREGPAPDTLMVELRGPPDGRGIVVRGDVRNVSPGTQGGVRVGIEFTEQTELEREILEMLAARR
jgi:hypothetical protein